MFRYLCHTSVLIGALLLALAADAAPKRKPKKARKKPKRGKVAKKPPKPLPPVVLPLERFVYVRGEKVPLALRAGAGTITLKPVDATLANPCNYVSTAPLSWIRRNLPSASTRLSWTPSRQR